MNNVFNDSSFYTVNAMTKSAKQFAKRGCNLTLLPLVGAMMLVGCSTMAPDYERWQMTESSQWQVKPLKQTSGISTQKALDIPWQDFIKEERLTQVIELALNNNRSLREVLADVEAARATYRIQRSDLFPDVDVSLSGNRTKSSTGDISTTYEAQGGFSSYELDLFGKNRSS